MFILVACEESQAVCKAFRSKGHIAFSCDIQRCSGGFPQYHICGNVKNLLYSVPCTFQTEDHTFHIVPKWDLIIAHPPCTMLSKVSSAAFRSGKHTIQQIQEAVDFFYLFYNYTEYSPGCRICIENPVPMAFCGLPPYSQTIQPYQFGDNWTKLTCLWLKNLPPLMPNCYVPKGFSRNAFPSWVYHKCGSKLRSKTFNGIATAMANQWNF